MRCASVLFMLIEMPLTLVCTLFWPSVLKKVKHRLVENMSSGTADALGLSRAILCNGKYCQKDVFLRAHLPTCANQFSIVTYMFHIIPS